jgi:Mn2+/Fe2+ NRAMP family transporter
VPLVAASLWAIVVFFEYRAVERTLFLLTLAYVAYPLSVLVVRPDWSAALHGIVAPTLGVGEDALLVATALVGTTISPYLLFYIQASLVDKGIDLDAYRLERVDVIAGAILSGLIAFFIVVVAATVLHTAGVKVDTAQEAARALTPLAGASAGLLFAVGLFGASVLSAAVMPLSTAYAVTEAFGWESGISKRFREAPIFMGLFTFLIAAGAAIVAFTNLPLIPLIVVSQDVNGLLLPVVLFFVLRLANDRGLMKEHANGAVARALGIGVAGLASLLSLALVAVSLLP